MTLYLCAYSLLKVCLNFHLPLAPVSAIHPASVQCEGDLLLGDLGHGLPLRAGMFDGAISISAVQWLCNADKSSHDPRCEEGRG